MTPRQTTICACEQLNSPRKNAAYPPSCTCAPCAHVIRPLICRHARNSETNPAGLNETYYFNSFTGTRNTIRDTAYAARDRARTIIFNRRRYRNGVRARLRSSRAPRDSAGHSGYVLTATTLSRRSNTITHTASDQVSARVSLVVKRVPAEVHPIGHFKTRVISRERRLRSRRKFAFNEHVKELVF